MREDDASWDESDDGQLTADRIRIDKWLWAAKFFKARNLATQAVESGRVKVNGERVRASRDLLLGDQLSIQLGEFEWDVVVRGLGLQRGPAPLPQDLYEETEDSQDRRALILANRKVYREPVYDDTPRSPRRDHRAERGGRRGFTGPMDSTKPSFAAPPPALVAGEGGGGGGRGSGGRAGGGGRGAGGGGGGGGGAGGGNRHKQGRPGGGKQRGGGNPMGGGNQAAGGGGGNAPQPQAGAEPRQQQGRPGGGRRRKRRGGGGGAGGAGGAGGGQQSGGPPPAAGGGAIPSSGGES